MDLGDILFLLKLRQQSRFPNPGFTDDIDHRTFAIDDPEQMQMEFVQFSIPSHHLGLDHPTLTQTAMVDLLFDGEQFKNRNALLFAFESDGG